MDEMVVERVLRAIEQVPSGHVVSYGDLGALVGIGPRQVGAILRQWGSNVTWWRVTNAHGEFPAHLLAQARPCWDEEGIRVKSNGRGCRMQDHRADLLTLAQDYAQVTAELDSKDAAG
ncbi:MAG: MGMT family protein [Ornithinimicrobium sp.]|nr:MGMT family protein [Ornithinimicrobium sp.]MDO5739530.1 MGMT family protein [Ornithinimicrobium sp.]